MTEKIKIISLSKTKTFPFLEFRGETENCYLVFRYINGAFCFGMSDRELKAELEMTQYSISGQASLKQMIEHIGFDCSELDFDFMLA